MNHKEKMAEIELAYFPNGTPSVSSRMVKIEDLSFLFTRVNQLTEALTKIARRHEFSPLFETGCVCEGHLLWHKLFASEK